MNVRAYPKPNSLAFYYADAALMIASTSYCDYYMSLRRPIILDARLLDTGSAIEKLLSIADSLKYAVVILPSVPMDGKATKALLGQIKTIMRGRYGGYGSPGYFMQPRFIAVAQGKDWEDFWACYQVTATSGCVFAGIPNNIDFLPPQEEAVDIHGSANHKIAQRRSILIHYLHTVLSSGFLPVRPNLKHCLIGLPHPLELGMYSDLGLFVHSAFTRLPFLCAANGINMFDGIPESETVPEFTDELKGRYAKEVWGDDVIKLFKGNIKASINIISNSVQRKKELA